jgi:hypothetical protein
MAGTDARRPLVSDTTRRTVVITVVAAVVVIIAMNLLARGLDEAVGGSKPGGAEGSSYATQATGLAGFTELVTHYGHDVRRIRGELTEASLSPDETVILTDPGGALTGDESSALRSFVERGGRLLLVGVDSFDAGRIVDDPPRARSGSVTYETFAPELDTLRTVRTAGQRAYEDDGEADVLVRDGTRVLAQRQALGAGEVISLADASVLTNGYLADEDNAALGLHLAGDDGRTIAFLEGVHGYEKSSGMSAIPSRWKLALVVLVGAAFVYAWARGRRLGPADRPHRVLPPARAEYVDALSNTLARTGDPGLALDGLGAWTRRTAAVRAGLPPDASERDVDEALRRLGLDDDEIDALRRAPRTEAEILALGRAAARVTDGRLTL